MSHHQPQVKSLLAILKEKSVALRKPACSNVAAHSVSRRVAEAQKRLGSIHSLLRLKGRKENHPVSSKELGDVLKQMRDDQELWGDGASAFLPRMASWRF